MDMEAKKAEYRRDFHSVNSDIRTIQAKLKPLEDEMNALGELDAPSRARIDEIRIDKRKIVQASNLQELTRYRSQLVGLLDGKTGTPT